VEFIRENTKFLFILVIPVYFYIVQSSILNKHSHFNSNGLVITHSHPLDKDVNNHDHTETEICFFANLHFDFFTFTPEIQIGNFENSSFQEYIIYDNKSTYSSTFLQIKLRGPPVFQVI